MSEWLKIDSNTPTNIPLEVRFDNDEFFIGRIYKLVSHQGQVYGGDATPYGNSECGCGVDHEFVTKYRIPRE